MAQILVPPANSGYDMQYAPHGVTGFEYSGNQYIFAVEGNEGINHHLKIHVQKSIDGGATWTETGTIDFAFSTGIVMSYCVCVDGGTAYVMAVNTWGANSDPATTDQCTDLQLWTYNLSTDGIAGPSIPSGAPQLYKFWHGELGNSFQVSKCVPIHLVRRGSGDMLFVYSGIYEVVAGSKFARLYAATFNGSSIGSPVMIGGQVGTTTAYTSGAVDVDGSGYLHVCCVPINVSLSHVFLHVAMNPSGIFGPMQTIESNAFFNYLDPPEDMSRLVVFGASVGFVGVRNDSANGAIYFYSAAAGQLNPSWTSSSIGNTTPVVINPRVTSCISTSVAFLVDNTIHIFWTRSGITPTWSVTGDAGVIRHVSASTSDLSTWTAEATVLDNTPVGGNWAAANVNAWNGTSQISVFGTFNQFDGTEFGSFLAITAGTSALTRSVSDTLTLVDLLQTTIPRLFAFSDTLVLADGPPQTNLTTVSGGGSGGAGGSTPPPGSGMGNCIFEFYEMQTPEDVEVLPTPKKYDQLGPMRFDKIGKVFGFRVRLIMNGTTTVMPYKVYGDDSESDPGLNSIFYQGSFQVRPGIDNVYEIQFPKSVNTDIFRLTFGPTADSFHRYDVLVKVHTSGMKGQAKWTPIR